MAQEIYLGVHLQPDGNQSHQFQYLLAKSNKFSKALYSCPIRKSSILDAYHVCYLPAITYSLPATSLTYKQLDKIQRKATTTFLNRMGFNQHFPRAVSYAPKWFGGLGMRHLYCEQGICKLQRLIAHLRIDSDLGKLLRLNINWLQHLSGFSKSVLINTNPIPGTRNHWLNNLRTFLHSTNCTITIHNQWLIQPIRQRDSHIMDHVCPPTSPNAFNES